MDGAYRGDNHILSVSPVDQPPSFQDYVTGQNIREAAGAGVWSGFTRPAGTFPRPGLCVHALNIPWGKGSVHGL